MPNQVVAEINIPEDVLGYKMFKLNAILSLK